MAATLTPAPQAEAAGCKPRVVGASMFDGSTGYRGDNLYRRGPSYAELGMGSNLGGLPRGFRLRITYRGRTIVARKWDIGLGGGDVFGYRRDIDLHTTATRPLRFPYGIALVRIQPASCKEAP